MPLLRLYEHHAEECARAAEQTNDPRRRALFVKLAAEWRAAVQELRQSESAASNKDRPDAPRSDDRPGDKLKSAGPVRRIRRRAG